MKLVKNNEKHLLARMVSRPTNKTSPQDTGQDPAPHKSRWHSDCRKRYTSREIVAVPTRIPLLDTYPSMAHRDPQALCILRTSYRKFDVRCGRLFAIPKLEAGAFILCTWSFDKNLENRRNGTVLYESYRHRAQQMYCIKKPIFSDATISFKPCMRNTRATRIPSRYLGSRQRPILYAQICTSPRHNEIWHGFCAAARETIFTCIDCIDLYIDTFKTPTGTKLCIWRSMLENAKIWGAFKLKMHHVCLLIWYWSVTVILGTIRHHP